MRKAEISRKPIETRINVAVDLDAHTRTSPQNAACSSYARTPRSCCAGSRRTEPAGSARMRESRFYNPRFTG